MSTHVTESEMKQIFKNRERENFQLLQATKKKTFEFYVNAKNKDVFLQWVKTLSSVEFRVNADLDNIQIKEYTDSHQEFNKEINKNPKYDEDNKVVFRIKISGKEKDLNRWNDNLYCVADSLSGKYDITYLKCVTENKGVKCL